MSDCVHYRLPGTSEIISMTGTFQPVTNGSEVSGFVVTDFLHQQVWQFVAGEGESLAFHSADREPVVISPRDYQVEAQAMLHSFRLMGVEKAVYSRVKSTRFELGNAFELFNKLVHAYPSAFVYLISSKAFGTWIGATPEVLADSQDAELRTVALAGTKSATDTSGWSEKELHEHRYVAEAVEATLLRHDCTLEELKGPFEAIAGPVKHLKTTFRAAMHSTSAWKIAMDLHPTPAVCGTPRIAALDLISSREMHDRLLYTGIIGIHSPGRSQLFVNLRCAQLQEQKAFLYLGGGYTIDSIPDLEWEETEKKAKTLLDHMG